MLWKQISCWPTRCQCSRNANKEGKEGGANPAFATLEFGFKVLVEHVD
jgi:hypothetical protein